jgi:SPP1 family predicted phage head-tail adaptor
MRSEKLDRRITIERYGVTYNDDNEPTEAWAALATVSASVQYASDGEKVRAAEVGATISVRFQIRYDSTWADVNPKDRVIYEGKTFDIIGVKELGRREGLEISAAAAADE